MSKKDTVKLELSFLQMNFTLVFTANVSAFAPWLLSDNHKPISGEGFPLCFILNQAHRAQIQFRTLSKWGLKGLKRVDGDPRSATNSYSAPMCLAIPSSPSHFLLSSLEAQWTSSLTTSQHGVKRFSSSWHITWCPERLFVLWRAADHVLTHFLRRLCSSPSDGSTVPFIS